MLGLLADHLLGKLRIPGLLGMLAVGVIMGPYALDLISPEILRVSYDLRMIALIVILLRAGLKIKREALNRVGKTALLMSVLPSTMEGIAIALTAPALLGLPGAEAAILGFVVAAVSPAVVVPSMIKAMENGRGTVKGIPTMVLASSSLDNAYVIVVFGALLGMQGGADGGLHLEKLADVPISILLGIGAGIAAGFVLYKAFIAYSPRATKSTLVVIGAGIGLLALEGRLRGHVPFSGLLAVMSIGFVLLEKAEEKAHAISGKLAKIWVPAEILLFVLVGAQVNISVAMDSGLAGLGLIAIGLSARSIGTFVSVQGAGLNAGEKLFCVLSFLPKATVQAAIGAIPLSAGVAGGEVILAVAVLSIIVTAPVGAIAIDISGKHLLAREAPAKPMQ